MDQHTSVDQFNARHGHLVDQLRSAIGGCRGSGEHRRLRAGDSGLQVEDGHVLVADPLVLGVLLAQFGGREGPYRLVVQFGGLPHSGDGLGLGGADHQAPGEPDDAAVGLLLQLAPQGQRAARP